MQRIPNGSWAVFSLVAVIITGCKSSPQVGPDTAALVNQKQIKMPDVEKAFQNRLKQSSNPLSVEEAALLKLNVLNQLITDEILMERASRDSLGASEAEINTKFTQFKKDYTEEKFQQFLKDQNLTVEDIKKELQKNATIEKLYNKEITSKISVSDTEINDYFAKNRASYNLPQSWHILHILVTPFPDPQLNNGKHDDATSIEAARQKVQQLLQRILAGEDFAVIARDYSEDSSSAPAGGDLRLLSADQLEAIDSKFRQAVQSLKVGETFPSPITTKYGYHLVKLLEKEAGGQHELTDPKVQADIRQVIFSRKENLLRTAYQEVVRNEATIRNFLAEKTLQEMGNIAPPSNPPKH